MPTPTFIIITVVVLICIAFIVFKQLTPGDQNAKVGSNYIYQTTLPPEPSGNAESINALLAGLPSNGGQVYLGSGVYTIDQNIWINKPNVTIKGTPGATTLIFVNGVNEPLVSIGSRSQTLTTTIDNITLDGLILDGNATGQTSTTSVSAPWLTNNVIDIRGATNVTISSCELRNGIASGVIADFNSNGFRFVNSKSINMTISSIVMGSINDSTLSDFVADTTLSSHAVVINNGCNNSTITNGHIINGHYYGISTTNCSSININNLVIANNGSNGISINDNGVGSGSPNVSIFACKIYDNSSYGFAMNSISTTSPNVALAGCIIGPNNAAGNTYTVTNGAYSAVGVVLF